MALETSETQVWPRSPGLGDVIQLLDEHHLVVLCDDARLRERFGRMLCEQLRSIGQTEVIEIDGRAAVDVRSLTSQLEDKLGVWPNRGASEEEESISPLAARAAGIPAQLQQRLIDVLRAASSAPTASITSAPAPTLRRRYYVWREADAMLEADVEVFGRLVNAMFGVAAESEHITLDPVVVQRVIFLGGGKLGAYAEDSNGQFCKWLDDGQDGSPFWEVMSMIERPAVITFRVDG